MSNFPDDLFCQLFEHQGNTDSTVDPADESSAVFDGDEDIEAFLRSSLPKVQVLGVGGGGNNAVDRLMELGLQGAETIAINTDAQHLLSVRSHKKLLIGTATSDKGIGAGNNPAVGRTAAIENREELEEIVNGHLVFITCGLGGGTGTGAAPVIAQLAKKSGALVISVCTLPFGMEGAVRKKNAEMGVEEIRRFSDMVVLVPNETLLRIYPNVSVVEGLAIANEILAKSVRGITELITTPQLVNLDFSDVRKVVESSGIGLIGVGEANESSNQAQDVVTRALNNPLLDGISPSQADRALVYVAGGSNFSIGIADEIVGYVRERIHPKAEIIWGASVEPSLGNRVRLVVIISSSRDQNNLLNKIPSAKSPAMITTSQVQEKQVSREKKGFLAGIKARISRKERNVSLSNNYTNTAQPTTNCKSIEEPIDKLENLPVSSDQEIFVFSSGGVPLAHLSPRWPNIVDSGDPTIITGLFSAVQDMADSFIEDGGVQQIVTGNKKCIFASQMIGDSDYVRGVAVLNRHSDEVRAKKDLMESIHAVTNLLRDNIPEWEVADHLSKRDTPPKKTSFRENSPLAS